MLCERYLLRQNICIRAKKQTLSWMKISCNRGIKGSVRCANRSQQWLHTFGAALLTFFLFVFSIEISKHSLIKSSKPWIKLTSSELNCNITTFEKIICLKKHSVLYFLREWVTLQNIFSKTSPPNSCKHCLKIHLSKLCFLEQEERLYRLRKKK